MKKIFGLFIVLFVLSTLSISAGATENKVRFGFTNTDMTQTSWDFANLRYNINDVNTGEPLDIPSFMINYEVKDRSGITISKGSGLCVNLMDAKLGSEEEYTVVVSTLINGQNVTHSICKKASPKKFAMKVNAADLDNNNLAYTFTRPKFNHPNETENLMVAADVEVTFSLNNFTYTINASTGHPIITEQAGFQNLKSELKKLIDSGQSAEVNIEPKMVFRGQVYTDDQSYYYQVTSNRGAEGVAVASK